MSIFALKEIDAIKGKQTFEKLLIDDNCLLDQFEDEINENKQYCKEMGTIYRYMQFCADGISLPDTHFKELVTEDNDKVKEYEFKSKHLRVYAIKKANGKIVIMAGFKGSQKRDIRRFQSIKRAYLESLKKTNP